MYRLDPVKDMKELQVTDLDAKISNNLREALLQTQNPNVTKRSSVLLEQYFASASACNQREFVGLFRSILALRVPSQSLNSEVLIVSFARFVVRVKLHLKFMAELVHVRSHIDIALTQMYTVHAKACLTVKDFWDQYKACAFIVVDAALTEQIINAEGSWSSVARQIRSVCCGSKLGQKMFGFLQFFAASSHMESFINGQIEDLKASAGPIPADALTVLLAAALLEAEDQHVVDDFLARKRETNITYKGLPCRVVVAGVGDEVHLRFAAFAKEHAADGQIVELGFENGFRSNHCIRKKFAPELLSQMNNARRAASIALSAQPWGSGEALTGFFDANGTTYLQLDKSFAVEVGFVQALVGQGGEDLLDNKILAILPCGEVGKPAVSLDGAIAALKGIRVTGLYTAAKLGVQNKVGGLLETLGTMRLGRAPNLGALPDNAFCREFKRKVGFFASANYSFLKGEKPTTVYGPAAMKRLMDEFRQQVPRKDDGDVTFGSLEVFHIFGFLLSEGERGYVAATTQQCIENTIVVPADPVGPLIKKQRGAASSTVPNPRRQSASASTCKNPAPSADDFVKGVDSLFD